MAEVIHFIFLPLIRRIKALPAEPLYQKPSLISMKEKYDLESVIPDTDTVVLTLHRDEAYKTELIHE